MDYSKFTDVDRYGWLPELQLASDLGEQERLLSDWGTDYLSGQQMGGSVGGLIGQYGLPALLGLAGPAGLIAGAVGSAIGNKIGGGIVGNIAAGEKPKGSLGIGQAQDLYDKLQLQGTTQGLQSGLGVVQQGLMEGVDKYTGDVLAAGDARRKKYQDLFNIEEGGLLNYVTPGGESGVYEGERMILDPDWEQKEIWDATTKSFIPDPEHKPGIDDYIIDEEYYRDLGIMQSRQKADLSAGTELLTGFEDEALMKQQYEDLVRRGVIKPEIDATGSLWDYHMSDEQLAQWMPEEAAQQQAWLDDFRTWENELLDKTPETSFMTNPVRGDRGAWYNPWDDEYAMFYGKEPQVFTGRKSGFPVYNEQTGTWEL